MCVCVCVCVCVDVYICAHHIHKSYLDIIKNSDLTAKHSKQSGSFKKIALLKIVHDDQADDIRAIKVSVRYHGSLIGELSSFGIFREEMKYYASKNRGSTIFSINQENQQSMTEDGAK